MNRRNFIQQTTIATGGMLISGVAGAAIP
ncbi:twin-arginine translocation signal domain-containing protein, partial [Enterobacter bugandensis]